MTTYLFVGPSLPRPLRKSYMDRATVLPPVAAGDLLRLPVQAGDAVGIIDGFFHRRPAVRHKEILDLLASGVQVHGAASMGALRAAELAAFGMTGHGRIFADYHSGVITADDEVALLHGTEAEDYEPYTEALVNVRYALTNGADMGLITRDVTEQVLREAARLPFTERTREVILAAAADSGLRQQDLVAVERLLQHAPDVKRRDARELLRALLEPGITVPESAEGMRSWAIRETLHLRQWRLAARGSHDPVAGWVPEDQVHRIAQVLAVDYPAFRVRVGLRYLAAQYAAVTGQVPTSADAMPAASPSSRGARTRGARFRPVGAAITTQAGGVVKENALPVEDVLQQLRSLGLLSPGDSADPGLDRWCTSSELDLPEPVRTGRAAARALFPHTTLAWHDPFLAELKVNGGYSRARERLVNCLQFNQMLRHQRPSLQMSQLRASNILAHFAERWDRKDLEDAVLERGFATVDEFLAIARPFYLHDKAHPGIEPLVIQPSISLPATT